KAFVEANPHCQEVITRTLTGDAVAESDVENDEVFTEHYEKLKDWAWRFGSTPEFSHNMTGRVDGVANFDVSASTRGQRKDSRPHWEALQVESFVVTFEVARDVFIVKDIQLSSCIASYLSRSSWLLKGNCARSFALARFERSPLTANFAAYDITVRVLLYEDSDFRVHIDVIKGRIMECRIFTDALYPDVIGMLEEALRGTTVAELLS
ncbi:hypothetical protein FOZ62_006902, partial [Perkinsus olseni]